MLKEKRCIDIKWFVLLLVTLLLTNLGNYLLFSGGNVLPAAGEPRTIIRYESGPDSPDPDMTVFFEALEALTTSYYHEVPRSELIEGAVRGMVENVEDPQTRFFNPQELEHFLIDESGSYGGIGVRIIERDGVVVVFETFPGTPADRAGISPGDRIVEADGTDLVGLGLDPVVELLRGPSDTSVKIKIQRPGADEDLELTVTREDIQVQSVFSELMEPGIGYLKIKSFDAVTANEFTTQLESLEAGGISRGLILDLRNNRGGRVPQAVSIAEQLVPSGEITRLVGRDQDVLRVYYSSAEPKPYPIVVLVNEDTASSAELLAGALQDSGAAVLVGKNTYGKASTQELATLADGSAILLTTANYLTPAGTNIDQQGIEPDYEVDLPGLFQYYEYFQPGRMEEGDYGPDVELLQSMLVLLGYSLEETGYFDGATSRALGLFQADENLPRTGVFDDLTWLRLREAVELASREEDQQLKKALELLDAPWSGVDDGGDR